MQTQTITLTLTIDQAATVLAGLRRMYSSVDRSRPVAREDKELAYDLAWDVTQAIEATDEF